MRPFLWVDSNVEDRGNRFRAVRMHLRGRASREIASDIGEIVLREVRAEAPEGRTGNLRDTLEARVGLTPGFTGRGYWAVGIISPEKYTGWVIEGRGWVRPVKAQVLHWKTKSGEDVFSMHAKPTEPNPFHERGLRRALPAMRQRWGEFGHHIGEQLAD